ncbi:autophagy-related protein 9a-like protein [Dermatophagoides farinae]|uniref:Autophagy-related protein 9 n=1 Tax=Dermatophagoides farinae TaxID=6954 RepID=A0A9D4P7A9_DERFA|nr:autophagy-related protein 9a-like protein [Dermatophagoides farinae]
MFEPMPTRIVITNQSNLHQSNDHHLNYQQIPPPHSILLPAGRQRQQDQQPSSETDINVDTNATVDAISTAKQPLTQQDQSTYQSFADIADPVQNPHLFIHVASGQKIYRPWQAYISDLDDFFERIYYYYQKSGFTCIVVENILELIEVILVVLFTVFFLHCIDYQVLFKNKIPDGHPSDAPLKITISDVLIPLNQIRLSSLEVFLLLFSAGFWFYKFGIAIHTILSNYAIRSFFIEALQIHDPSLYSWQEVQLRLINAQSQCLLRETHLDELAIHNRLLRRANYMIALINKGVLPIYYRVPLLGEYIYFTSGLEFNFRILLFRGVFSLFDKNWRLRDEIKSPAERLECARRFSNRCLAVGLLNLILLPMIFLWQSLYAFYTYVEAAKREPTIFALRTWSRYGQWFCRHFNELDHEVDERLNRAYRPAVRYMNSFRAPLLEIFARFVQTIAAILLSVLIALTVYDEDVITVEHVLLLFTGLGATIAIAKTFLPDPEPNRWTSGELDAAILQHIHYRPHNHPPHTIQARNAMGNIFVYKSTTILEELLSPLIVPYILIRHLRSRSLEIIDFFRVYTLELTDIGDVCTFSQFNFHQNGHRIFTNPDQHKNENNQSVDQSMMSMNTSRNNNAEVLSDDRNTTRNGKLELSLINFKLKNPKWQPPDLSQMQFIDLFTRQSCDDPVVPNLIFPVGQSATQPQATIAESKSTIDFCSPTTSAYQAIIQTQPGSSSSVRPDNQQRLSQIMNRTSQMSDSSTGMLESTGFGFNETRRRLLQLRYGHLFSEQEKRDNQMALSSLYFHQLVSESQSSRQQSQNFPSPQQQQQQLSQSTSYSGQLIDGSRNNESIPLLRSDHEGGRIHGSKGNCKNILKYDDDDDNGHYD